MPAAAAFVNSLRLCLALLLASAGTAQAAGFQRLSLPMDMNGPALQGGIWYPCAAPAGQVLSLIHI